MDIHVLQTAELASHAAVEIFISQVQKKPDSVLGLATGATPLRLYKEIIKKAKAQGVSFKGVRTVNLDEYVGLDPANPGSYAYFMHQNLFKGLDILKENTYLPQGNAKDLQRACEDYNALLKSLGGIDLQLLGLGHNGHIGFNEPGTAFDSLTHAVQLTQDTRRENAVYFKSMANMPTHALTLGIAQIMQAKHIVMLVFGKNKAEIVERFLTELISPDLPASILKNHPHVDVFLDGESAAFISEKPKILDKKAAF